MKIARALLSCHDKTGLDGFARALAELGVELIASGGTAAHLARQGLAVKSIEQFAGLSEQLDGRIKTLHPKVHAGILARRDDAAHLAAVGRDSLIDLVVVNLYPFEETVRRPGASLVEAIEHIDVGGVALLRAAAKNLGGAVPVCRPSQYDVVAEALRQGRGELPEPLARQLAVSAFELTSAYDARIAEYLGAGAAEGSAGSGDSIRGGLPETAAIRLRRRQALRYGENPHQRAAWYVPGTGPAWGLATLTQLQGKELSYNNLLDIDAAFRCLLEFHEPSCAIIKHSLLCGLACAPLITRAYERAHACDAESAFGGIVGINRPLARELAERLTAVFLEVVLAPSVEPAALAILSRRPNLRVVTLEWPAPRAPGEPEYRQLSGSWLLQDADPPATRPGSLRMVTRRAPTEREQEDLRFAWTAVKHARSNGIVLAASGATLGIGQGQPSRVGAVRLALEKAGGRCHGAVAASDGFFPFADSIDLLAVGGVTALIQPGGSIRDDEVVAAADAAGMAMLVTGVRRFRH